LKKSRSNRPHPSTRSISANLHANHPTPVIKFIDTEVIPSHSESNNKSYKDLTIFPLLPHQIHTNACELHLKTRRTTMKTTHMITILLAGTSLQMFAQMPPGPPPDPIAMALDKNDDQKLSASEISGAARALIKLDKDKDQAISAEELRPEPPKGRRKKDLENEEMPTPPSSTLLTALDSDSSGDLSKEELIAAPKALLTLDEDSDGKLSTEEAGLTEPSQSGGSQGGENGGPPGGENGGPPPPPPGGGH
jgi:Ca2+-binding EF-hand superfamily protein